MATSRIEQAWYASAPWLVLLLPLTCLFRGLSSLRRWLYQRGVLARYRAGVPVVVVGNITVGGTGKTPVVIALVEALQAAGLRPGVISRGYGARKGVFPREVQPDSDAANVGDEPLLIHRRTGAPCVVDPRRARAAQALEARHDIDLLISDDGLQHYALQRDVEIALLDQARGIGNGYCLPAGPLREPPSRLREVDWVLYRGGEGEHDGVAYYPDALVQLVGEGSLPCAPDALGGKVHAVAGIGQPGQFFDSLRRAGFELTEHVFPDHHAFTRDDLASFGDAPVIMTEKDAVKCRHLVDPADAGRFWFLRIQARLPAALVTAVLSAVSRTRP